MSLYHSLCRTKLSLSAGLVSAALLAAPAARADVAITEEARAHFTAGVNFLEDPDGARYEDALREFQAAYAASPSWKILGNLGLSAMKLERDGEAIDAWKKYLAEGGKEIDREERMQVERDLKTLQASLVTVTLSSNEPSVTLIDERVPSSGATVVNRYRMVGTTVTLGIRAGHHRLTAEHDGFERAVWEFDATPQQSLGHSFVLEPRAPEAAPEAPRVTPTPAPVSSESSVASERGPNLRTFSYVAFGVGALGLAGGTFFALRAKSKYDDGNALCPSFPCDLTQREANRREDLGGQGDTSKALSIVGFAAGGLGVAAGVTLLVLSGNRSAEQARLVPILGYGSAGVRGSF